MTKFILFPNILTYFSDLLLHDLSNYQKDEIFLAKGRVDYNCLRINSSLRYLTPVEFEKQWEMRNK